MDSFNRDRAVAPVDATGTTATAEAGQRRARDSLFLMARIRMGDGETWADVRVRNLSAGGLMAELDEALAIGLPVELELRGVGRVSGRIAWQAEGRTGVAFDVEIDPMKARKPVGKGKPAPYPAAVIRSSR